MIVRDEVLRKRRQAKVLESILIKRKQRPTLQQEPASRMPRGSRAEPLGAAPCVPRTKGTASCPDSVGSSE